MISEATTAGRMDGLLGLFLNKFRFIDYQPPRSGHFRWQKLLQTKFVIDLQPGNATFKDFILNECFFNPHWYDTSLWQGGCNRGCTLAHCTSSAVCASGSVQCWSGLGLDGGEDQGWGYDSDGEPTADLILPNLSALYERLRPTGLTPYPTPAGAEIQHYFRRLVRDCSGSCNALIVRSVRGGASPGNYVNAQVLATAMWWSEVTRAVNGLPAPTPTPTPTPACFPPPAGMVSWWQFEGNSNVFSVQITAQHKAVLRLRAEKSARLSVSTEATASWFQAVHP